MAGTDCPKRTGGLRQILWQKAGFVARAWFPRFANWRWDGYDFDSRWDEELVSMRCKRIMDCFSTKDEWFSYECKRAAGFGKDGEKNFEGTVTELQMRAYLIILDFRQRVNRQGTPYGWPISVYTTPESLRGYELRLCGSPGGITGRCGTEDHGLFPGWERGCRPAAGGIGCCRSSTTA